MNAIALGARDAIAAYIRAKDENRPYLMNRAFDSEATLTMVVRTDAISFPTGATGREAITDILVRGFGQTYENVKTFCLSSPPEFERTTFSCNWLVGMSAKENRVVRVGCGRYDWMFRSDSPYLVEKLTITIDVMQLLPANCVVPVMDWLDRLPYPWCLKRLASRQVPAIEELGPIRRWLAHENA